MALLLSSKFVRCLSTIARGRSGLCRGQTYAYRRRTYFEIRDLVRNFSASSVSQDTKLDRSLRRLDQDVRRIGRVSRRELEDALEELKQTRSATSTQSLLVIRCCGSLLPEETSENRTRLVEEVWKMLNNLGVPMDISHYNALLRVYLENEHPFSPTEFLADLEGKGIEPNRVTYQRLVERYCQGGDIEGATHILEFMRAKQLPVNEYVFNSLILGHSQARDMKSASDILNVMKHAGLVPNGETYATLLCGYAKYGDMESIRSVLEQCKKEDVLLVDQDYMEILYALAINDHHQHVDEIIEKFQNTVGFNHDAFNLILKLTNKRKYDVAKKILFTMSRGARDGQLLPSGTFFIRQLVRTNCPFEETVALCEELKKEGLNDKSLLIAAETCLLEGNVKNMYGLLSALKTHGYSIRQHYFWPIITSHGKAGNSEGILDTLKTMSDDYDLTVNGETLRDYAVQWLFKIFPNTSPGHIISLLRTANVPVGPAVMSVVYHLLSQNDMAGALQVAREYRISYQPGILRKPLLQAYQNSRDDSSFAGILRSMFIATEKIGITGLNSTNRDRGEIDDSSQSFDRFEMIGQILLDAVLNMKNLKNNRLSQMRSLLQAMCREGLGISNSVAERLVENVGNEILTSEISDLLEKLTTGETFSQGFSKPSQGIVVGGESHLKNIIRTLDDKGESSSNVKRQLLTLYCRNRNLEKAEQLLKELQNDGVSIGPGITAQLIDLYVSNECLEKALNLLNNLQDQTGDFVLDKIKVVKLSALLVKKQDFEGALNLLNEHSPSQKAEESSYILGTACRQLLNNLAEGGHVENVTKMFNCLVENGYIEVNNNILGPLIRVHIVRNDLDGALKKFEECCHMYHSTPLKNELTCKLIQAEDAVSLQKLTDLSTKVHGEVNSLYDLVFAFVECGRIRQARKILETPGLLSRPQRVQSACKRYSQEGMVTTLEGLVEATKSLSHVDSSEIYQHLLTTYCKKNDTNNAMGLWIKLQEENLQPTDEFLIVLGNFLKNEGLAVPFVIPEQSQSNVDNDHNLRSPIQKFTTVLEQNNISEALNTFHSMEDRDKLQISKAEFSSLLHQLLKSERDQDAKNVLLQILKLNLQPQKQIFQELVEKIASSGDINTLQLIDVHLSETSRKIIAFNSKLCHAYMVAGKTSEYLDNLESEIDQVASSEIKLLAEKFPKRACLTLLKEHPELHPQFQNICEKYFKKGSVVPFSAMWMFYAMEHQYSSADKVWNQYMSAARDVKYHILARYARDHDDQPLANYVMDRIKQSSLEKTDHVLAYNCFADILLSSGQSHEAIKFVNESVDSVSLNKFANTTLEKLQLAAKQHGVSLEITQKGSLQ